MFRRLSISLMLAGSIATALGAADASKSRKFQFDYGFTVTGLTPGQTARIWLPMPPSNPEQTVELNQKDLPAGAKVGTEGEYGNRMIYVEAKGDAQGKISLSVPFTVRRVEVRADTDTGDRDTTNLARFLKSDAVVPVGGKCLRLLNDKDIPKDQTKAARVLYDVVYDHMRYSKEGTEWGRGDTNWACDSGFGNCSDFHSLFISMARAQKMPAKFEIGFPLPEKRGSGEIAGYHCWAKFKPEGGKWIAVDISEADKNPKLRDYYFGNLTEDRVMFSTGRDIMLSPRQAGPPLNFFIYPYVEVDGKPYPSAKIEKRFSFKDLNP